MSESRVGAVTAGCPDVRFKPTMELCGLRLQHFTDFTAREHTPESSRRTSPRRVRHTHAGAPAAAHFDHLSFGVCGAGAQLLPWRARASGPAHHARRPRTRWRQDPSPHPSPRVPPAAAGPTPDRALPTPARRTSQKMSWQQYVDTNLIGAGCATAAGIYDLQGNPWAYSPGFAVRVPPAHSAPAAPAPCSLLPPASLFFLAPRGRAGTLLPASAHRVAARRGAGQGELGGGRAKGGEGQGGRTRAVAARVW